MAIEKPAPWTGTSGTPYVFYVFEREPDVPARLGLYIYAKRNEAGAWVPVYMGHGDLSAGCTDAAVRRCIDSKGATHLHLRLNGRAEDRETELQDLLAHYANAFAPEGCHDAPPAKSAAPPRKVAAKGSRAKKAPAVKTSAVKKAAPKPAAPKPAATKSVATKTVATKTAARKSAVKTKPKRPRPRSK